MKPTQIKVSGKTDFIIKWDNASESKISLMYLRDECPCAGCKGETILFKTYRPPKPAKTTPDMYIIKKIQPVGEYAIQITWKDGHDSGIYTWDYLLRLEEDQHNSGKQNYDKLI